MVLTANKAFVAGDVIRDNCLPITKTIEQIFKEHCHHCMQRSDQPKKCSKCHQMYYCNKMCQSLDWNYHKNECKLFTHKNFKPQECLSTERMLIRLWLTIESNPSFVTENHKLFDGSQVCMNDIEIDCKQLSTDIERMVEFRMICNHFKSYGLKFEDKELLRYYGFVVFNSMRHSLFHYHYDLTRNAVGIGVFLETYNLKHSCLPNTAYINSGMKRPLNRYLIFDLKSIWTSNPGHESHRKRRRVDNKLLGFIERQNRKIREFEDIFLY